MPTTESETPPPSEGEKKERRSSRPSLIQPAPEGHTFYTTGPRYPSSYGSPGLPPALIGSLPSWSQSLPQPPASFTMTVHTAPSRSSEEERATEEKDDLLSPRLLAPLAFATILVLAALISPVLTALFHR